MTGALKSPRTLYVHVPFCVSRCPYCDFAVVAGAGARGPASRIDSFVEAVHAEIRLRADGLDDRFGRGRPPLDTLYFGGGTPSLLPTDEIAGLVELVRERFGLAEDAEVTIESNPGPAERGDLAALRRAGISRVSFGAQSLVPGELRRLGRRHSPLDVGDAVGEARAAGIPSVNLDLLYDIPGQSLGSWIDSLEAALGLAPDHLSLYALTLDDPSAEGLTGADGDHLPATTGALRWREVARAEQDDDRAAAEYHFAAHQLAEDGWRGYEISNWARPGHESRHNLAYWEREPYEAVGPGAHAFDGFVRRWNAAWLDGYVAALVPTTSRSGSLADEPKLPPGGSEVIDTEEAAAEEVILGLRTDRGVPRAAFDGALFGGVLGWALGNELVESGQDERVRLTTRGRLLSNELFARIV